MYWTHIWMDVDVTGYISIRKQKSGGSHHLETKVALVRGSKSKKHSPQDTGELAWSLALHVDLTGTI